MKRSKVKTSDLQGVGSVTGERAPKDRIWSRSKTRFFAIGRTVLIIKFLHTDIRFFCSKNHRTCRGSPIDRAIGAAPVECLLEVFESLIRSLTKHFSAI